MKSPPWTCPVEAIRAGVDFHGARVLARLSGERATFLRDASVELTETGFVGAVRYFLPSAPDRVHIAHLGLGWAPRESLGVAA